jgi:hypothetical protein
MIFSAHAQLKDTKCDANGYDMDQELNAVDVFLSAFAVSHAVVAELESCHPYVSWVQLRGLQTTIEN